MSPIVEDLVWLSRNLGDPSHDLAILAEGNASARDGDSFWVKASGFNLSSLTEDGLVEVDFPAAYRLLDKASLSDAEIREALKSISVGSSGLMPSVETFMHAFLLALPGVGFVGHTHPTPLLSLISTTSASDLAKKRIFPDEVVCCGPETVFVPYADPGLPLAQAVMSSVEEYIRHREETPKTIWLENHGLITLGQTAQEVLSGTLMSVKAGRVWLQGFASGLELKPLSAEQIDRIHTRPDEHYRQALLRQLAGNPIA
ncbi:MAG: class II aldolase [Chlorobia bacterium]|nr:class II aldolase [Fimbriimonadaceae bacterium]